MNDKHKNNFPRLSEKEFLILEMLINKGAMFGLEMVEASNGTLKRGTIYITLQRMSDKGYLDSSEEPREYPEIGIPRRKYVATGLGQKIYIVSIKASELFTSDLAWGGV